MAGSLLGGIGFGISAGQSAIGPVVPTGTSGIGSVRTSPGRYTIAELEALWIAAGGKVAAAPMAAAIAMAESGGDSTAQGHNTNGSIDRGLWQINSIHGVQSTLNVIQNVKAAISISNNGTDWGPWTTFTSGAYKQFLSGANASAPSGFTNTTIGTGTTAAASAVSSTLGFFENLFTAKNLVRAIEVIVGGLLLLLGLKSLTGAAIPVIV